MIKIVGRLKFDPDPTTEKFIKQSSWKKQAMVMIGGELDLFYSKFIEKAYGIYLVRPQRLAHLTIVADRYSDKKTWEQVKKKWDGKKIELTYDPDVRGNNEYWWLRAKCKVGDKIRDELGLGKPYFPYHITIGSVKDKDVEYSEYITKYADDDYVFRYKPIHMKNKNIRI